MKDRAAPEGRRLLMLSHYFEAHRGGVEIVAAALAKEMSLLGYCVTWLATGAGRSNEGSFRRTELQATNIIEKVLNIPYPLISPVSVFRIFREARSTETIVIHDALYMTSVVAFIASRIWRKPLLVVQHIGLVPYRSRILRAMMVLANKMLAVPILKRAEQVVFISQITEAYFSQIPKRRKPLVIFNGVDTHIFGPVSSTTDKFHLRTALALPHHGPIALFVGRFTEKKGLSVLEALARRRPDLYLAFAGWGPLDPRLWNLPNIRVFDHLAGASLADLYRASDVLLLPSVGEGFPLVVQEALACGLSVICGRDTAKADPNATPFVAGIDVDLSAPAVTAQRLSDQLTHSLLPQSEEKSQQRAEFARCNYAWSKAACNYAAAIETMART